MPDKSARGLVGHWVWAGEKGLVNASTARALATACRGVLEVQEDWENLDITTTDLEKLLLIFKNLRAKKFTPISLKTYESRFRRAVASYLRYLDDPSTWRHGTRKFTDPGSEDPGRPRRKRKRLQNAAKQDDTTASRGMSETRIISDALQEYPYPIRSDLMARLIVPRDVTTVEINRLIAWARTLATDYEPSS